MKVTTEREIVRYEWPRALGHNERVVGAMNLLFGCDAVSSETTDEATAEWMQTLIPVLNDLLVVVEKVWVDESYT